MREKVEKLAIEEWNRRYPTITVETIEAASSSEDDPAPFETIDEQNLAAMTAVSSSDEETPDPNLVGLYGRPPEAGADSNNPQALPCVGRTAREKLIPDFPQTDRTRPYQSDQRGARGYAHNH